MDEPLSNLDARLRVEMRAELKRLQRELGVVTLYVTHDQAEAMTLATRIAVMDSGSVQQFDTPWNVYHRPANLFVAGFLGSPPMNFLEGRRGDAPVIAGVRPEDVEVSLIACEGWSPARVYVVESTGNESFAILDAEGVHITVRVPAETPLDFDQTVWFRPRPDKIRYFDPRTKDAI
jgi:multiple sugar transport system ATP-binding protein